MPANHTDHVKGLLITGIGGLALTVDIPLLKLANGEAWSVLLLRTGVTFLAALVIWAVWRLDHAVCAKTHSGPQGARRRRALRARLDLLRHRGL